MARTKKSRGGSPFELKSGNSPHKFIGGLVKNVLGGIGKFVGMGSGGNANPTQEALNAQQNVPLAKKKLKYKKK